MLDAGPRNSAARFFLRAFSGADELARRWRPPVPRCAGAEGVAQRLRYRARHRLARIPCHATQVFVLGKQKAPTFALAGGEAACMPLQVHARPEPFRLAALHARASLAILEGVLNAAVYGWSCRRSATRRDAARAEYRSIAARDGAAEAIGRGVRFGGS